MILSHGTLTEQHVVAPHECASEQVHAGSAFVEGPGQVHNVRNSGRGEAVVWWATIFPQSDGPGGIYPASDPECN